MPYILSMFTYYLCILLTDIFVTITVLLIENNIYPFIYRIKGGFMSSTETLQIKNYIGLTGDKPIRFIASDVDGTLVNDAKAIPDEAIEAIRAARESGIRVAIASGRAWNEMNDVIEKLPCLRYFMCTNGAYVMDKEEKRTFVPCNL